MVTPALLAARMKTPGGQEHAFDLIPDEPQVLMLCDNTGLGHEQDGLGLSHTELTSCGLVVGTESIVPAHGDTAGEGNQ